MKRVMLFVLCVSVFGLGTLSTASSKGKNGKEGAVVVTISCLNGGGVCVSWHHKGSNVWHNVGGIRIYEDPYPWGLTRVCPTGSQSAESIFIFDSGTPTSSPVGVGYVNADVCADDSQGKYSFVKDRPGQQVYTDYDVWKAASDN